MTDCNIILRTNDNVHFHFSSTELARQSSFFASLLSLPTGASHQPENIIIELDKAKSTTLALLLSLLGDFDPCLDLTQFILHVPDIYIDKDMDDLFRLADAYDLFNAIGPNLSLYYAHDLPLQFVIAAVMNFEVGAVILSRALVSHIPLGPRIKSLLAAYAPTYEARWTKFENARDSAWTLCTVNMRYGETMFNGFNDFGQTCKKAGGCSTYKTCDGDFQKARAVAAQSAISAITNHAWSWDLLGLVDQAVRDAIKCHAC